MNQKQLEKFQVNAEQRTIVFSVCSDTAYERYDQNLDITYDQILVISEDSVDLSRLNNGSCPILWNHQMNDNLGIVERAWIAGNKVYVQCRFSKNSQQADRIWKDILDSILKSVSIGYEIQEYNDVKQNGKNVRYVTKFQIFQCTICSAPADPTVGFRNLTPLKKELRYMDKQLKDCDKIEQKKECGEDKLQKKQVQQEEIKEQVLEAKVEQDDKDQTEDLEKIKAQNEELKAKIKALEQKKDLVQNEAEVEKEEQTVDDETKIQIEKIGSDFGLPKEEIDRAIKTKMTIREFKNKIKTLNFNYKQKDNKKMSFKKEFRDFIEKGNFDKPFNFRTFTGDGGFGGQATENGSALIGTDVLPLQAILQKKIGVKGYRVLNGLTHNISIPVQNTRITAYQTSALRDAITTSAPGFESVTLQPHKIGAQVVIGKQLLTQVNDDVVSFVIDSALKQLSYKIEDYMLGKVVAAQPTEINYSALSAFSNDDALSFQAAVDGLNLDFNAMSFVMSPSAKATLKGVPLVSSYPKFICENDEINGFKVNVSGCVSNDNIYFGAWDQMVLGIWDRGQGMSVVIDPFTQAANGNLIITVSLCIDAAVVQKGAFALGKVQESSSSSESSSSN